MPSHLLIATALTLGLCQSDHGPIAGSLPGLSRFSVAELQAATPVARANLRRALRAEGAVLLTDVPGFSDTAAEALDALSDCFQRLDGGEGPVQSPSLLQGGLQRRTLATSTDAGVPGELPNWAAKGCPDLLGPAQRLRSLVGMLLLNFAHSADTAAWPEDDEEDLVTAAQPHRAALGPLVRQGTLIEQFHSYRRLTGNTAEGGQPLSMHTDAGLLQALAVRWRAAEHGVSMGLEVELPGGRVAHADREAASGLPAQHSAGGLLLLLGQAAQEWLPKLRLRAAPHAIAAHGAGSEGERLVFGVMVLPPADWPILAPDVGNTTFGQWWQRAQLAVQGMVQAGRQQEAAVAEPQVQGCLSVGLLQSRLQDQANTCPAGSIYCWMQCQTVPSSLHCKAERAVCKSDTTGKLCPEDGTHDPSCKPACPSGGGTAFDISGAGEQDVNGAYRANGWAGGQREYLKVPAYSGEPRAQVAWDDYWASRHFGQWVIFIPGYKNGSALYYTDSTSESPPESGWRQAEGAAPVPRLDFNHSDGNNTPVMGEGFCNGVLTDMHMLGFAWTSEQNPCLIFLFHGWELTNAVKFWATAVVAVLAAIFAEWLVAVRRWEAARRPSFSATSGRCNPRRLLRQICKLGLYALARSAGYLVMLITMTFSVELFMAVIVGLTIGYACFNMATPPGEDMTACCQAGQLGEVRDAARQSPLQPAKAAESGAAIRFQVTGMTCDSCRTTVRRAVESLNFVRAITELSVATGALELLVDEDELEISRAEDAVCNAVEAVGFAARPSPPSLVLPSGPGRGAGGSTLAAPLVAGQ